MLIRTLATALAAMLVAAPAALADSRKSTNNQGRTSDLSNKLQIEMNSKNSILGRPASPTPQRPSTPPPPQKKR